jgi:hypothetical protein
MSEQGAPGAEEALVEEVRSRYAQAAGPSVTFTGQAAPGMHSAVIRAVRPLA